MTSKLKKYTDVKNILFSKRKFNNHSVSMNNKYRHFTNVGIVYEHKNIAENN